MGGSTTLHPSPEENGANDGTHEPQQQVDQVNPDGVLHARDATAVLGVLVDVHLAEDTKYCAPEHKQHKVPGGHNVCLDEGHHVDEGGEGAKSTDHGRVDLKKPRVSARLLV